MTFATEITRLQKAKTNIISSLEEKGVTVPANTTYSGVSALIDSIPEPVSDVVTGSITYTTAEEYDREMGVTATFYYVTLTFTDIIKGKGGRVVLFDTHTNTSGRYYPYYIYFDAAGNVTSFVLVNSGHYNVALKTTTWNKTGDTVTLRCYCDWMVISGSNVDSMNENIKYISTEQTAIWFAETF